jgi:alpha-ribazole phosphatase
MTVYLLRHTETTLPSSVCIGQTDVALSATFPAEARRIKKVVSELDIQACYTSPLVRCKQLAEYIFKDQSLIKVDRRLMELNFGVWEMKKWDEIEGQEMEQWSADFVKTACPGGESYLQLQKRVMAFWQELQKTTHQTVLVVTHAGVIRALLSTLLGMPLEKSFSIAVEHGKLTKITIDKQLVSLVYLNK